MNVIKSGGGYRLIAELIPRGVIAVVDSSDVVKIVSRRLVARDREMRMGVDMSTLLNSQAYVMRICLGLVRGS
jgi:hypothetical protein